VPEKQTIIFLHIPKTAGTTLLRILDRHYRPDQTFSFDNEHLYEDFLSLTRAQKAQLRLLRGHMNFGPHELLPNPVAYFTVLREPIDRVISYYYFIRRTPAHYCYDLITSNNMSLLEFVESKADHMVANAQTRMLSGLALGFDECTEETLERAKENLQNHFAVVGLMEKFDTTLALLRRAFGWHDIYYRKQNVTANRPRKSQLPSETIEALLEVNQLDIKLYEYAQRLFGDQIRRQGPQFKAAVKLFQVSNALRRPPASTR
jgi:hypothetical protein